MSQQYPQGWDDPRRPRQYPPQQPPWDYSQQDRYSPNVQQNVQQHNAPQWHAQPSYPPPQPPLAPRKKRIRPVRAIAALVVLGGIIAIVTAVVTSGKGSFKAVVADFTVMNPADLAVTVHVTNKGSSAATPTCTITAQDPSGAYSGVDVGTLTNPVQPGATATYVDNVTITNEGAAYITNVTVSC